MSWFKHRAKAKRDHDRIEYEFEQTVELGRYVENLTDRIEDARQRNHFGEAVDRALTMRRHA